MTEPHPQRPVLATLICIWEVSIVVLAIVGHFLFIYVRNSYRAAAASSGRPFPAMHVGTMQEISTVVSCILALAAAIALWQMRRSAFYLLATRTAISAAWWIAGLVRFTPPTAAHSARFMMMHWIARGISFATVALSVTITWYVYDITSPKLLPLPIEAPTPTPPTTDESVSRFYISNIDDRNKSN